MDGVMKKRLIEKLIAIIVLFGVVLASVSACQTESTSTRASTVITPSTSSTETTSKPDYLSSYALAQIVSEAINSSDQTSVLYQSIPDRQRPAILLDDFVQYISLLRRGISGMITSLTRISQEEMAALFSDLRFGTDLKHIGFYLHYRPSGKQDETMAFFMQQAADGMPYLDKAPIAKALAMQNFAALYFDALDRSDREALSVLVSSKAETRAPRLTKADRILSFYQTEVVTASPSFQVNLLMPDRIIYAQQIYVDAEKTRIGTRSMTVFADGAAGFVIEDPIPDQLAVKDLQIMNQGKELFDLGTLSKGLLPQVTSSQVNALLGQPILHNDSTCTVIEGNTRDMTAYYNGLIINGTGRCDKHQFWRVDLKTAALTNSSISLKNGLSVGDTLDTLLLQYPFIDDTNFQIQGSLGNYVLAALFEIDNQKISRITLMVSGG